MASTTVHVAVLLLLPAIQPALSQCRNQGGSGSSLSCPSATAYQNGSGNCCFNNTLCSYRQGYRHQLMSNWTACDTGAVAEQLGGGNGPHIFSDLNSPELSLPYVSCVEFRYESHMPPTLSLFGVVSGTVDDTLLYQGPNNENYGKTVLATVPQTLQMLKIRAYGWGGGGGYPSVGLQYVLFHPGNCTGPACSFNSGEKNGAMCGWQSDGWVTQLQNGIVPVVRLNDSAVTGTLATGLTRATFAAGLCVEFVYAMNSIKDTVSLSIQPLDVEDNPHLLWTARHNGTRPTDLWVRAAVGVQSPVAFKLIVRGRRCNDPDSLIGIANVTSTLITDPLSPCLSSPNTVQEFQYEGCRLNPATTTKMATPPMSLNTSTTSSVQTGKPTTSVSGDVGFSSIPNGSVDSQQTDGDSQSTVPVAVGSALGGIVIGIVATIAVVIWMKRRNQRGHKEDTGGLQMEENENSNGNQTEDYEVPVGPSAGSQQYEHPGTRSPASLYTSLQNTTAESGRSPADHLYESTGATSPPNPYTSLESTATGSEPSTADHQYEYTGDLSPPNVCTHLTVKNKAKPASPGYYNVVPENSAYQNVVCTENKP